MYLFVFVRNNNNKKKKKKKKKKELGSSKVFYSELEGCIVLHSNTVCNEKLHGSVLYIYKCTVSLVLKHIKKGRVKGQIIVYSSSQKV